MNFELELCEVNGNVSLVQTPKKLKTRPNDFNTIKGKGQALTEPVAPEPVVEEPVIEPASYDTPEETSSYEYRERHSAARPVMEEPKEEIDIDAIIKAREEEEAEPEQESMDNNIEFAYAGRVVEPEVSAEDIDRIKSLGDDYKGEIHPRVDAIMEHEPEPEPKYSEKDYIKLLKYDCYSPRTKKYLEQKYSELEAIIEKIENTENEIEEITEKYKMESEIASKLTAIKKETYGVMTWINSSDFKILKNEKTQAVNNLFKSYEDLFNENQQKFKKADEELEKTNSISAELGRREKAARESLQHLNKKRKEAVIDNYTKVEEIIELDKNMKKQASEMTLLTGIEESQDENKFDALRRDED